MGSRFEKLGNRYRWLVNEKPFLAFSGEVHNSSASTVEFMQPIWEKLEAMELNTVIIPVYWELSEINPDEYDFSLVGEWIKQAKARKMKLILLWFGTWKNAQSTYVPEWIKCNHKLYPRAILKNGAESRAITPLCKECCELDARAFGKLMRYLKETDTDQTVIAVQVENESGLLGTSRDYSDKATTLFEKAVPKRLTDFLNSHLDWLSPTLKEQYCAEGLNWSEMFSAVAEEAFTAYLVATYINEIATVGKAENSDIPLFVNAWTQQCPNEFAGLHPSGGPTAEMHAIWKAAAPSLDAFAPDLYLETFAEEFSRYAGLKENPFLLPETRNDRWAPAISFFAFGEYGVLCFSPFAVEEIGETLPLANGTVVQGVFQTMQGSGDPQLLKESYRVLKEISPYLTGELQSLDIKGFIQNKLFTQTLVFSDYSAEVRFKQFIDYADVPSGGLAIALSENEFIFAGFGFSVSFYSKIKGKPNADFVSIEEGRLKDGKWVCTRRLNGDEYFASLSNKPSLIRVKVYSY